MVLFISGLLALQTKRIGLQNTLWILMALTFAVCGAVGFLMAQGQRGALWTLGLMMVLDGVVISSLTAEDEEDEARKKRGISIAEVNINRKPRVKAE